MKMPISKGHTLKDSIYVTFLNDNSMEIKNGFVVISSWGQGVGQVGEYSYKRDRMHGIFEVMKQFCVQGVLAVNKSTRVIELHRVTHTQMNVCKPDEM